METMKTKMDVVERLSFLPRIYSKVKGSGFIGEDGNEVNMCGVVVSGNYAFVSNNHFVGKILLPDGNPPSKERYWDFTEDSEMAAVKEPPLDEVMKGSPDGIQKSIFYNYLTGEWEPNPNYDKLIQANVKALKSVFFNWKENLVKLKKNSLLQAIDDFFQRKDAEKGKNVIIITPNPENETIDCKIMRMLRRDEAREKEFSIPMHIASGKSAHDGLKMPAFCSFNVLYLYHILSVYREYDVVDLCFDNSQLSPAVIKGVNPRVDWKPDIRFAIAQCLVRYE